MRDPKRIDKVLQKIKELWEKHPDMRLGQLIVCTVGGESKDIFYIEDDKLMDELDELDKYYEGLREGGEK